MDWITLYLPGATLSKGGATTAASGSRTANWI